MKIKIKKIVKTAAGLSVSLFLLASNAYPALAWDMTSFGTGDLRGMQQQVQNDLMGSFGADKAELNYMANTMNVSRSKKMPPQVTLTFDPADPVEGEKVTVVATPTYFMNSLEDMYFTWFLKTEDCDEDGDKDKCDLNDDNEIDIEDWKIKAMRIIANDDFNWEAESYSSNQDNDSYDAIFGGDDQKGKTSYCYFHDVKSGDEFQIECNQHLFPHARVDDCDDDDDLCAETGDESFGVREEQFWRTDPKTDDTAHTGNVDEANVAGLGIYQFSWNYSIGDEVGVVVEGVSVEPTQTSDSSYRTMWGASNGLCQDVSVGIQSFGGQKDPSGVSYDDYEKDGNTYTYSTEVEINRVVLEDEFVNNTTLTIDHVTKTLTIAGEIANLHTVSVRETRIVDNLTETTLSSVSGEPEYTELSVQLTGAIYEDEDDKAIDEVSDLNRCLEDSLVSPAENGLQSQKIDVSLTYTPTSPINDSGSYANPSLSEGDELNLLATVINAKDPNYVQYTWEVFQAGEVNPDSWDVIPKSNLPEASQMVGLGLNSFKFRLNIPNPDKYFRVKVSVKENVGHNLFREGHSDIVIPINSATNRIRAYNTTATNLSAPHISQNVEICAEGLEKAVCPVAKNEIISVGASSANLTDYLWQIDGKPFVYDSCYFDGCNSTQQTNVAYFPVLKDKGEKYTISLIATDRVSGGKVNLSRVFEVIDPEILIDTLSSDSSLCGLAGESCKPVLLGSYVDLDGKAWKDYSKINFWAITNNPIKLKARTIGFTATPDKYVWVVDGNQVDTATAADLGYSLDAQGILTLPPKEDGQSYSIGINTVYSQNDIVKKALNSYWKITYDQFFEKMVAGTATINMQNFAPALSQKENGKIFATVYAALPEYFIFLLRIVISTFLILFVSRMIFSLFPERKEY